MRLLILHSLARPFCACATCWGLKKLLCFILRSRKLYIDHTSSYLLEMLSLKSFYVTGLIFLFILTFSVVSVAIDTTRNLPSSGLTEFSDPESNGGSSSSTVSSSSSTNVGARGVSVDSIEGLVQDSVRVASSDQGIVVAYEGIVSDDKGNIYSQLYDLNGKLVNSGRVNSCGARSGEQANPDVAMSEEGSFGIAWESDGTDTNCVTTLGTDDYGYVGIKLFTASGEEIEPAYTNTNNEFIMWTNEESPTIAAYQNNFYLAITSILPYPANGVLLSYFNSRDEPKSSIYKMSKSSSSNEPFNPDIALAEFTEKQIVAATWVAKIGSSEYQPILVVYDASDPNPQLSAFVDPIGKLDSLVKSRVEITDNTITAIWETDDHSGIRVREYSLNHCSGSSDSCVNGRELSPEYDLYKSLFDDNKKCSYLTGSAAYSGNDHIVISYLQSEKPSSGSCPTDYLDLASKESIDEINAGMLVYDTTNNKVIANEVISSGSVSDTFATVAASSIGFVYAFVSGSSISIEYYDFDGVVLPEPPISVAGMKPSNLTAGGGEGGGECSDEIDNDGDGTVDYFGGCDTNNDNVVDDLCISSIPQDLCRSNCDNSGGRFYPRDPGCTVSESEYNDCGESWDNDGDGLIDYTGGCDIDKDKFIDYICGCDDNGDGKLSPSEMGLSVDECKESTDTFACAIGPWDGELTLDVVATSCNKVEGTGRWYPPDPECVILADDSERDEGMQVYGESSSSSLAFAPEIESQGFWAKILHFFGFL